MAKRTLKSNLESQYNRELKRIKQFIRRAEKRGFIFEEDIIPKKPKRITKSSVLRLTRLTPSILYTKSTAVSESGKVIIGTEKRAEERKHSAQKAAHTRKENLRKIEKPDIKFENERRKKDNVELILIKDSEEQRKMFNEGEIVYNSIKDMINNVVRSHYNAGQSLSSMINHEIATYGKDSVLRTIAMSPKEAIELAEIALRYNPGDNRHDDAIRELQMIITGAIPTAEELRELQDTIESDIYTDIIE